MSRSALNTLVTAKVLTGGRRTTAANEREVYNAIIAEAVNNVDDADVAGGYMKISAAGRVDVSFINSASASGKFLRDDGSWQTVATGAPSLDAVLLAGNSTGDIPIISEDAGIELRVQDGGNGYFISSVGVVGVTNSPFINPNKVQLTEDALLLGHDTLINIEALEVNVVGDLLFNHAVVNTVSNTGIDFYAAGLTNRFSLFVGDGGVLGGSVMVSDEMYFLSVNSNFHFRPDNRAALDINTLASGDTAVVMTAATSDASHFIFKGFDSTGNERISVRDNGALTATIDNGVNTGEILLGGSIAGITHTQSALIGMDNLSDISAYAAFTALTARLQYYNATNSGGVRIEDGQNYIDHTVKIYLDSPIVELTQAQMYSADGMSILTLGGGASSLSYNDGSFSGSVNMDATSLNLNHTGFIFASAPMQIQYLRNISGSNAINTSGFLYDSSVFVSIDWNNRYLRDSAAAVSIDWDGKSIYSNWTFASGDLTLFADPTSAMHAATKNYVDNAVAGLIFIRQCNAASIADVTISSAPASLDGVTGVSGVSRWLLKDQTDQTENGVYLFNGTGAALTRVTDADSGGELANKTVPVVSGSTLADTWWTCINDTITIGVTNIVFTQTAGSGTYTNGAGITLTGNVFSIAPGAITNTMLAGSIAASNLIGTDIATVGTITTGTLGSGIKILLGSDGTYDFYYNGGSGALARLATANTSVLTTDGSGVPSWAAQGTAFNKSFGTASSTITEGNDTRVVNDEIRVAFDGGGSVVAVNSNAINPSSANGGTITDWYIEGDVSGSIVVDLKKNGTSMPGGGGNKPTLSGASTANAAIASWSSSSFVRGDKLEAIVNSSGTLTKCWLVFRYSKTS